MIAGCWAQRAPATARGKLERVENVLRQATRADWTRQQRSRATVGARAQLGGLGSGPGAAWLRTQSVASSGVETNLRVLQDVLLSN